MRILLDECVNPRIREAFREHDVLAAAQGGFDILVTLDRGFEFEHNLAMLSLGIIIIHVAKNRMEYFRPLFPGLVQAVESISPGKVIHVGASQT